eukprot:364692-Chlamydomonas_euryale.AAC.13
MFRAKPFERAGLDQALQTLVALLQGSCIFGTLCTDGLMAQQPEMSVSQSASNPTHLPPT